jgi:hypothetical protein
LNFLKKLTVTGFVIIFRFFGKEKEYLNNCKNKMVEYFMIEVVNNEFYNKVKEEEVEVFVSLYALYITDMYSWISEFRKNLREGVYRDCKRKLLWRMRSV